MTKQQHVAEYIKSLPEGERISGSGIHDIVLGLEVSPATVYRALHMLEAQGIVDASHQRVHRDFSRELSAEVVTYVRSQDGFVLLTEKREAELRERLNCTALALQLAFEWSVIGEQLQRSYTFYGTAYHLPDGSLYSNQ